MSTPTPSSLPGGVFRGSLRSLRLASRVAAQGRAQPGRALLPALLLRPLRPPASLLLFLRLLPRFLSSLLYLSGTFSDYLSYSRCLPAPPSSGPRPIPREDKLAKGRVVPGEGPAPVTGAPTEGHRGGGAGQGVFLTRGSSSSCRAKRLHPTRRPGRAFPGVGARHRGLPQPPARRRPSLGSSSAPSSARPLLSLPPTPAGSSARRRDFLGLRQLLGGGAGRGRR